MVTLLCYCFSVEILFCMWVSLLILERELYRSPIRQEFLPKWNRIMWWCIHVCTGHWSFRKQNQHIQTQKGSRHVIFLTDLWRKITTGVTTCLSDLQILLCFVANSQKCTAQMKGNYYFAEDLLERTTDMHMLVRCIRLKVPKIRIFFPSIISSLFFFPLNIIILEGLFLLFLNMGMLLASESHFTRQMSNINQCSRRFLENTISLYSCPALCPQIAGFWSLSL